MNKYKKNRIFIWALITVVIVQIVYLYTSTCNVPIMDYWRYINMFVEKMYTGELAWADIWRNDGIHRSPLQFIYFLINVSVFHMNAQTEVYAGAFLMAVTAIVLYIRLKKDLETNSFIIEGIAGVTLIIIVYNLNQWELIAEQFALSFASRMFLFLVSFVLTSSYLQRIEKMTVKNTGMLGVFYIFVVEMVGGGYFPAYVASIGFTIVFHYFSRRKTDGKQYMKYYISLLGCLVAATAIYLNGVLGKVPIGAGNSVGIIEFIKSFMLGVAVMLGVSIVGFTYSQNVTAIIGTIVFLLYLYTACLFIKKKYYKRTYMPILLYGYAICAMGLIYLGRMDKYGIDYAYSPRYVCETNVAIWGFLWIIYLYVAEYAAKNEGNKKRWRMLSLAYASVGILMLGILTSDYKEWRMAPNRKIYGENLISGMLEVEQLSPEDFAVYQAEEGEVRAGIEVMKKYELGIFYYRN